MDFDDIETIAVLGAGTMGHGIAELAAIAGYDVVLRDIEEEFVREGHDQIEWSLGKLVEQDQLAEDEADAALARVEPMVDLAAAVADADVVVEAVPERFDIKQEVFEAVDDAAPSGAIIATNTSSISITDLSETTDRPEQFCGMHFFNPPIRMPLVEVIAGAHTDEAVLDAIEALAEAMGKSPVRVKKDSPGFIVNRVLVPLLNEAAWLVHEGEADVATVDATAKFDMGLPMGTFELTDRVGLDVSLDVLQYIHGVLGEAYEPCPLLVEKVDAGELGTKADVGFYDYDDGGVDIPPDAGDEGVQETLLAVMANEVAKLLADDVAALSDIDDAMMLGAAFPDGPSRLAGAHGLDALVERLEARHEATGHVRYEPSERLRAAAEAGGFDVEAAPDEPAGPDYDTLVLDGPDDDGVTRVTIDREQRLNSISTTVLDELDDAIDRLDGDPDTRAIVLEGAGDRAFSAGADVQSMAGGGADPLAAVELSRLGQRVFGRLETCDTPTIAAIDGYCLGGGMELATGADFRIASERSTFGQPEHDLGLLPGWGGTQRLQHLVGLGRAKEIIFTADHYDAETMRTYGFLVDVVSTAEFDERVREFAADIAAGPPIAQRYTKRAMHLGRDDVDAGLEYEAQAFGQLFTTDDLMTGITAFMSDENPEFEGS
ncbi:MAG: 3-hydroxyacyl-CoA dehydrogenase NAD-binding domain-containing protein [Halobacteriales archaeon]